MELNELMAIETSEMTETEKAFSELHRQIIYYANMTADSLLWLSKNLSEMKNSELYREAGFETFDEYSEKALNLKRRQAYNYARIYENLGKDFVHSNAQIGVSKLVLLASVSEEKREEIEGQIDIETVSVSELKKALKDKDESEKENSQLKENIEKLNQSLEELQSKETERVSGKSEELAKLKDQLEKAKSQREKLATELEQTRAELQDKSEIETVEKIVEVEKIVQVKDEEAERRVDELSEQVEKLQSDIKARTAEVESLNKKIATSDEVMTKFKLKFEDLQKTGIALFEYIGKMDEEKQAKCRTAIAKVVEGWKL